LSNTSALIEALIERLNAVRTGFAVYYDRAPDSAKFPYAVMSGLNATDLAAGDLTSFDVDIWTDDKLPTAAEDIEALCDEVRNALHNSIIAKSGIFAGHIGYENRDTADDQDADVSHRRLFFAARVFYYE